MTLQDNKNLGRELVATWITFWKEDFVEGQTIGAYSRQLNEFYNKVYNKI